MMARTAGFVTFARNDKVRSSEMTKLVPRMRKSVEAASEVAGEF